MDIKKRLKVLVSAYACEPGKGSEPEVGWNWVKLIAKKNDVWVLTRKNNQKAIESELMHDPIANAKFVYIDLPRWMRFWKKGQYGIHLYYYLWQIYAFLKAKKLSRIIPFDLAHQVTFVCDWMPSFLSLLPIPFIWGPIGSQRVPKPLRSEIGWKGLLQEYLKISIRWFMQNLDPFFKLMLRRSKIIIATNRETASRIPKPQQSKVKIIFQKWNIR